MWELLLSRSKIWNISNFEEIKFFGITFTKLLLATIQLMIFVFFIQYKNLNLKQLT